MFSTEGSQVLWSQGDRHLKTGRSFLTTGEILSLAVLSGKGKGEKEKRDRLEITRQEKKMKKMNRERFSFCQRDPCLLPIFLLCLIEDFDLAFHLSFDFVTLILRPVYFLHLKNKAMTNTHSNFSKIAQNIPVTTLHYSNPASMSSSCLNFSWKYRLSCNFQEYWQC